MKVKSFEEVLALMTICGAVTYCGRCGYVYSLGYLVSATAPFECPGCKE